MRMSASDPAPEDSFPVQMRLPTASSDTFPPCRRTNIRHQEIYTKVQRCFGSCQPSACHWPACLQASLPYGHCSSSGRQPQLLDNIRGNLACACSFYPVVHQQSLRSWLTKLFSWYCFLYIWCGIEALIYYWITCGGRYKKVTTGLFFDEIAEQRLSSAVRSVSSTALWV